MTRTADLISLEDGLLTQWSHRNRIINGRFDIWQRGATQSTNGYGSDDRWSNENSGTTKVHSRQAFTLGQTDVPGNPAYFSRTVVTSVAGVGNYCFKSQRIEGVATFAGTRATLSFYAKADAPKNIAVELVQAFGSGGSASAPVTGIGAQKIALTAAWRRYVVTFDVPSIAGKTLGTDGNHLLALNFWFDGGSNHAARSAGLGQQSGTFDLACVQFEPGDVATPFERRHFGIELSLCQRYYETSLNWEDSNPAVNPRICYAYAVLGNYGGALDQCSFAVRKRVTPTITVYNGTTGAAGTVQKNAATPTNLFATASSRSFVTCYNNGALTAAGDYFQWHYGADAEL